MLTGDKKETAINIGKKSKILTPDMELLKLEIGSFKEKQDLLELIEDDIRIVKENKNKKYGLIVEGAVLSFIINDIKPLKNPKIIKHIFYEILYRINSFLIEMKFGHIKLDLLNHKFIKLCTLCKNVVFSR
jgi:magnesium-transporting ATPase (P-type)